MTSKPVPPPPTKFPAPRGAQAKATPPKIAPPPTLYPAFAGAQMRPASPAARVPLRKGLVLQRSKDTKMDIETLGFDEKTEPKGYGSVSLSATLNGLDLGKSWSVQPTYTEDTEHAEDAVVDLMETIEMFLDFQKYPTPGSSFAKLTPLLKSIVQASQENKKSKLVIANLTASPCSSKRGTCKKKNTTGCADRLIELATRTKGWLSILITADHYYQPTKLVDNAKDLSKLACADMEKACIDIKVSKK